MEIKFTNRIELINQVDINNSIFDILKIIQREQIDLNQGIKEGQKCYDDLKEKLNYLETKCYEAGLFIRTLEDEKIEEWNEILSPKEKL
jgi:hypothetical protein